VPPSKNIIFVFRGWGMAVTSKEINHLGLVAGMIDELGIVEGID
jgi:hypothetical protein